MDDNFAVTPHRNIYIDFISFSITDLLKTHMDTVATFGESKEVEVKRLVSRLLELLSTK